MPATNRIVFAISGLACASCALDVGRHLRKLPGVRDANLNYMADRGYVEFDPSQTTWDAVARVLRDLGYTVVQAR